MNRSDTRNWCRLCVSAAAIVAVVFGASAGVAQDKPAAAQPPRERIEPFKIAVDDAVLRDLKERLARTRWPDQIDGTDWEYGVPLSYMKELVAYWQTRYDWREQERRLNAHDQFVTRIDGLDIHFVHVRSKEKNGSM
jgi:hypothetical protein